jgi:hypothetical protein
MKEEKIIPIRTGIPLHCCICQLEILDDEKWVRCMGVPEHVLCHDGDIEDARRNQLRH